MADSILEQFQAVTGCTDQEIGVLVGVAKPTVQAYRCGRLRENLNTRQIETLSGYLRMWRSAADELLAQLEMLS